MNQIKKWLKFEKPSYATMKGWSTWEEETKRNSPIGFFMFETLPDIFYNSFQLFWKPIIDSRDYLYNRYVTKTHVISTGLPAGRYHEIDDRLLHGIFTELVNYVECEAAWMTAICSKEKAKQFKFPWQYRFRFFRWTRWRNSEAGRDYLLWQSENDADYLKVLGLYDWWTKERPNRKDPFADDSEYVLYQEQIALKLGENWCWDENNHGIPEYKKHLRLIREAFKIEEAQQKEDTNKMLEVIKLRRILWT